MKDKFIVEIACGSSHSAAVTDAGQLYTWGQGNYGRLGHGDTNTQLKPKPVSSANFTIAINQRYELNSFILLQVAALKDVHVIKVACGSRDAQTLCLTKGEQVYSWGDGDFGKLGRGGSDACTLPCVIEKLNGKKIIQIGKEIFYQDL